MLYLGLAAVLTLALPGCKKSESSGSGSAVAPPPPKVETVAQIHWIGKKKMAADTNSATVMDIWNMPETVALQKQTLDKLALGPWLIRHGREIVTAPNQVIPNYQVFYTNYPAASLLRPLVEDLLQEECYFEARNLTNRPGELALALRLADPQAALWETNVTRALELATGGQGTRATNGTWSLALTNATAPKFELTRAAGWTIVGLSFPGNGSDTSLATDLAQRVQAAGTNNPFALVKSNEWVSLSCDIGRLANAAGSSWQAPAGLPKISLAINGAGQVVQTHGELTFSEPLPKELPKWNLPTNLVSEPLVGFTAIRGIGPYLKTSFGMTNFESPDEFFTWTRVGAPFLSFFATPLKRPRATFARLCEALPPRMNPLLEEARAGRLEATNDSLLWKDCLIAQPYIKTEGDFVTGGFGWIDDKRRSVPSSLFPQILGSKNIVLYDWELTGPHIESRLFCSQFLRFSLNRAQVPPDSPAVKWLFALRTKLGNCGTTLTQTSPTTITLSRQSTVGVSAVELQLFADWTESPTFPSGLNTFRGPVFPLPANRGIKGNQTKNLAPQKQQQ